MAYIYKITNKINGKSYIGKTEKLNPFDRFEEHLREKNKDRCKDRPLYRALNKYGLESFYFEVLEETDRPEDREMFYISQFETYGSKGYNATRGGDGKKYVDETEVLEAYFSLKILKDVAKHLNICTDTVRAILRKYHVVRFSPFAGLEKKVKQIDAITGEVLMVFNSTVEAGQYISKPSGHISTVCCGKRRTAYGYKWEYV